MTVGKDVPWDYRQELILCHRLADCTWSRSQNHCHYAIGCYETFRNTLQERIDSRLKRGNLAFFESFLRHAKNRLSLAASSLCGPSGDSRLQSGASYNLFS
jgi:hypothetical protein